MSPRLLTENEHLEPSPSPSPSPTLPKENLSRSYQSRLESHESDLSSHHARTLPDHKSADKDSAVIMDANDEGSGSEIQSIMDQFDHSESADEEEIRLSSPEFSSSVLDGSMQHPPRKSSLEQHSAGPKTFNVHWKNTDSESHQSSHVNDSSRLPGTFNPVAAAAAQVPSVQSLAASKPIQYSSVDSKLPSSPPPSFPLSKPLPPEPDPESDLPFDFHRFLEQLRHRTADPVAKFLRSFLVEFGKKQWMAHEQVKIIGDFLTFITSKMAQCEVWRGVSEAEFDNAREGMEKLVMNRLYSQTFSPSIPPPISPTGNKGKNRNPEKGLAHGRRGQHQEDVERDEILGQKVRIYSWIEEEHLDIPSIGENGRRFLALAQQGLRIYFVSRQQNHVDSLHRAPQDQDLSRTSRQNHLCSELL